ncbi:hypothetical protein NUSPORA_02330 [Nucleospora cyclopteri]
MSRRILVQETGLPKKRGRKPGAVGKHEKISQFHSQQKSPIKTAAFELNNDQEYSTDSLNSFIERVKKEECKIESVLELIAIESLLKLKESKNEG